MTPAARFSVGLTGGIGCGKTTVSDLFAARGAAVIDTDVLAHSVTAAGGPAIPALRAAFGEHFIAADGAMDRTRMRELVFAEPAARHTLEAIVHPLIRLATEQAAAVAEGPYLLFAVPLLVESGSWKSRVDRVLVIDCPEALQIERVMRRSGLARAQVEAIMATQATRVQRLAAADDVLHNEGEAAALPSQVDALHATYLEMAGRRNGNGQP